MAADTTSAVGVSKRRAFFTLLGETLDDLPRDAVNKTIAKFPTVSANRATLVQRGSTADVDILARMVRVCLPEFKFNKLYLDYIPEDVKEAQKVKK